MTQDTASYLRPRTIERIFGHVLAWLVRLGVIRGVRFCSRPISIATRAKYSGSFQSRMVHRSKRSRISHRAIRCSRQVPNLPSPCGRGVRGRGQFQYRCYSCPLPLPEIGRLASGSPIAHSKHSCSARRSRKSANATDRPLVARESRNVRRRGMDQAVSWITARGLPMVHLRAMPLHLFRARS
jgi:hypothetical protein